MEEQMRRLTCPHCGREILVPAELETFSCVYCGEKLTYSDFASKDALSAAPSPADLEYVRTHLMDCIRDYPNYYRNFNKKKYEQSFQAYREGIAETYRAMDRYLLAQPERRDALLQDFTEQFLRDWEDYHSASSRGRSAGEKQRFVNKMTLAWYTVPAIRDLGLSVSEDYPRRLQAAFVKAYPNNVFEATTYQDLAGGFRKHGMCFITSAVCAHEGKPDDCEELTAFRAFRDGWLSRTADGAALVEEYYEIAPSMVLAIEFCDDADRVYSAIRRDYLDPCYAALQRGREEICRDTYIAMVERLKQRYPVQ